ncbi:hypothetical protein G6F46_009356 [Rhizopus delemar]|uniref:Uncharacterized protein n=2 Tax=Rhizopus TaxID=4842 RepID=A0A9P7CLH4_9FUNG|nr:hypothetical protein G6F55_008340 [Rhizopus delemar]KAG1538804.1 hypothetical protein G6F51_009536 [Rhizopus arrhizus]KAG1495127.1 hypothetical protein G6F54_007394 [Rhizopus delemar]KAG1495824.1 hypothetical protein G6F53_012297 [Rhizopus delemar]KAG1519893.1 hypothetical protein G6F52_008179 [Rhizopus delemar]
MVCCRTNSQIQTDFVLVANGQEVGCGEIQFPGTTTQLVEEDRARTAEIFKRQLYVRIRKSKDPEEFVTFGMVFSGFNIELYVMAFDFENTSLYQFYEIEKLKLPSSPELYTNIEETIENLASFKVKCSIYIGQEIFKIG